MVIIWLMMVNNLVGSLNLPLWTPLVNINGYYMLNINGYYMLLYG